MDTFKVILVGEAGVGKTQLLRTFAGETFSEAHTPTRGAECTPVIVFLEGREVTLQIWDTATWWSQDRFRNVTTKQYREAHAVVYVYDSNDFQTLHGVRAAFDDVVRVNEHCIKMLVGTKYDLKPKNLINKPMNQGEILANTLAIPYFEASAKVAPPSPQVAFFSLAKTLLDTEFPKHMVLKKEPSLIMQALTISDEKADHDARSSASSLPVSSPPPAMVSPKTAMYASLAVAAFQGSGNNPLHTPSFDPHTTTPTPTPTSTPAPLSLPAHIRSHFPHSPHISSSSPIPSSSYVVRPPSRYVAPAPFGVSIAEFDHEYNIVLLGDAQAGKTQLLRAFVEDDFSEIYTPSTTTTSCSKTFDVDGRKIKLQLWDTAEKDAAGTATALQNAQGVLVLYDMSEAKTFENCRKYFEKLQGECPQKVRALLVGNKTDLPDKTVEADEAQKLANSFKVPFFEISARASFNVETMFRALVKEIRMVPATR